MNKATQSLAVGEVLRLPTDQINADAIERIGFFHADEVAALADIIASDGQNEPIVVAAPVPKSKDRRYRLVYAARQTLLNAISAKAKLLADNATADAAAAADTATWAGIGGSTSGTDVASTVKPGGGVAAGNVSTAALQDDSVTGTLQGYNGSASSGAGRDNWITLVSWTENLEAAGDIIAIATIKQSWSSTNKPWGFRIVIDGMEAFGTGGIMVTDSVALSGHMRLESEGDYVVSLDFAAEDSTVSVVAGAASMITFKRYK